MYHSPRLSVIRKSRNMFRILGFIICLSYLASCRSQGASNEYKDAKHHPSEQISNENKKANKKQHKDFLKTQKKNNKAIGKRGSVWSKKKKQYTK
jgi:hypothetical protein